MANPGPSGNATPEPDPIADPAGTSATEQTAGPTNPTPALFSAAAPSPGGASRWRIGDGGPRCRRYRRRYRIGG